MQSEDKPLVPALADDNFMINVIGLGGVGGIVAKYLALYLGGQVPLTLERAFVVRLIDGDSFEDKNAERMAFSMPGPKSEVIAEDLQPFVVGTDVELVHVHEYVDKANLEVFLHHSERCVGVTFLCVDNHKTRKLVSDRVKSMRDHCLISGGNDGVGVVGGQYRRGTWGNVQVHIREDGVDLTPPIDAYHPEIADPQDKTPKELEEQLACGDAIEAGMPQVLFTNLSTASAMLNAFYLWLSGELSYAEACFDLQTGRSAPVDIPWGEQTKE